MRHAVGLTVMLTTGLAPVVGCGEDTRVTTDGPRAVEMSTAGPADAWTLSILVVNNAHFRRTITADIDGRRALESTLAAAGPGANNPMPTEYRYSLTPGVHRVVVADADERVPVDVTLGATQQRWIVVQDYDTGVPLEAKVYDRRPGFG